MSTVNFYSVSSPDQFKELLSTDLKRVSLINFWAPWAEPCKQMNEVVAELAKKYSQLLVLQVEAEEQQDISESFDIEAVPSVVLLRGHELLGRINGADAARVTALVGKYLGKPEGHQPNGEAEKPAEESKEELVARMHKIMQQSQVVLFMKGEPEKPRCGFSRQAVDLLREQKVEFTHFDILEDEDVRQGLKKLNDWPTYPQFIVKGEFVGGLDVVKEMVSNGEFNDLLVAA